MGCVLEVGEGECGEELVDDPFLFDDGEKGTCAAGMVCRVHDGELGTYLMRS